LISPAYSHDRVAFAAKATAVLTDAGRMIVSAAWPLQPAIRTAAEAIDRAYTAAVSRGGARLKRENGSVIFIILIVLMLWLGYQSARFGPWDMPGAGLIRLHV
jgi:hypothetical protein